MIDLRCEEPRQCLTGDSPLLAESSIGLFDTWSIRNSTGTAALTTSTSSGCVHKNLSGVATRDGDRHEPPWSSQCRIYSRSETRRWWTAVRCGGLVHAPIPAEGSGITVNQPRSSRAREPRLRCGVPACSGDRRPGDRERSEEIRSNHCHARRRHHGVDIRPCGYRAESNAYASRSGTRVRPSN
jgi:hypothetical protein